MKKVLHLLFEYGVKSHNSFANIEFFSDGSGKLKNGREVVFTFHDIKDLYKKIIKETKNSWG